MRSEPGQLTALSLQVSSWVERHGGRRIILLAAALLSLPNVFSLEPSLGLDASWEHSLQYAAGAGWVFGQDVLFTYGPLGYLLTRSPVSKLNLLLYDLFVMGSLCSIYGRLLAGPMRIERAGLVLAVALITHQALGAGAAGILFIIAGYWLWRFQEGDFLLAPGGALAASVLLFFSKVNFGLVMIGLIPCYALALWAARRKGWRAAGLTVGFALLVLAGSGVWHVALGGYLRGGLELIIGYNEAMFFAPPPRSWDFVAAAGLTGLVMASAFVTLRTIALRDWVMACPWVMLAAGLLFKNSFVRADVFHAPLFLFSLPLLLAVWGVALPGCRMVKVLFGLSVLCEICQLEMRYYAEGTLSWAPLRYARGAWAAPRRQDGRELGAELRAGWPELALPEKTRSTIGQWPVAVMPMDSTPAILNGLNLKELPVLQSYIAYTPWLDAQNARFLSASGGAEFILYSMEPSATVDNRPAAWDESIAKRALIQNYSPCPAWRRGGSLFQASTPALESLAVLRHSPGAREYVPISTNLVTIALDQDFAVPASTDWEFLWLDAERTARGKLAAFVDQPAELSVSIEYSDGTSRKYRAVLPILRTGVLINYRVESAEEIRRWLSSDMTGNATVRSLRLQSLSPRAFQSSFQGKVVTCRLAPRAGAASGEGQQ